MPDAVHCQCDKIHHKPKRSCQTCQLLATAGWKVVLESQTYSARINFNAIS